MSDFRNHEIFSHANKPLQYNHTFTEIQILIGQDNQILYCSIFVYYIYNVLIYTCNLLRAILEEENGYLEQDSLHIHKTYIYIHTYIYYIYICIYKQEKCTRYRTLPMTQKYITNLEVIFQYRYNCVIRDNLLWQCPIFVVLSKIPFCRIISLWFVASNQGKFVIHVGAISQTCEFMGSVYSPKRTKKEASLKLMSSSLPNRVWYEPKCRRRTDHTIVNSICFVPSHVTLIGQCYTCMVFF